MEGDLRYYRRFPPARRNFYPRPPGGGRLLPRVCAFNGAKNFYPRPPGGGRLLCPIDSSGGFANFYPRPPGGGRQSNRFCRAVHFEFLSTPSGWRATPARQGGARANEDFYPRPPGGGRLALVIHACSYALYFYPRPPGGGRRAAAYYVAKYISFLSTPSG